MTIDKGLEKKIFCWLPSISIIIPTLNEENNIEKCLNSVFKQYYLPNLYEVIIVDNGSIDKTLEIVSKYNVKIIKNKIKDAEISKIIGLRESNNEYFIYLDADIEIIKKDFFLKLVRPFIFCEDIAGSFGRFYPKKEDSAVGRYLRYHPLELDPVFQYFCTDIEKTIISKEKKYSICCFKYPNIPPIGICLYKKKYLLECLKDVDKFMDIDVPCLLSLKGHNKFAYVSDAKFYHVNVKNLFDVINKRMRNLKIIYLPNEENRLFQYFNLKSSKDIFKIVIWVIYANLFFPAFFKSIYMSVKNKDLAFLYESLLAFSLTDAICFGFLKYKYFHKLG